MGFKIWTFWFALARWIALVALALVPTLVAVVAYRWWKGRKLWSMEDLPVAAEVTLCLAWLSSLFAANEILLGRLEQSPLGSMGVAVLTGVVCAVPVALASIEIDRMKRAFGPRWSFLHDDAKVQSA